jgi:hypothetical protein
MSAEQPSASSSRPSPRCHVENSDVGVHVGGRRRERRHARRVPVPGRVDGRRRAGAHLRAHALVCRRAAFEEDAQALELPHTTRTPRALH